MCNLPDAQLPPAEKQNKHGRRWIKLELEQTRRRWPGAIKERSDNRPGLAWSREAEIDDCTKSGALEVQAQAVTTSLNLQQLCSLQCKKAAARACKQNRTTFFVLPRTLVSFHTPRSCASLCASTGGVIQVVEPLHHVRRGSLVSLLASHTEPPPVRRLGLCALYSSRVSPASLRADSAST